MTFYHIYPRSGIALSLVVAGILLTCVDRLNAQESEPLQGRLAIFCKANSSKAWMEFNDDVTVSPSRFFSEFRADLALQAGDSMALVRTQTDQLGVAHYRYQQYHGGIKVEGGEFLLHGRPERVVSANGHLITGLPPGKGTILPWETALNGAIRFCRGDGLGELFSPRERPSPVMVFVSIGGKDVNATENFRLAYRFDVTSTVPLYDKSIYVDATSGVVIRALSHIYDCTSGTATTQYNSNRTITSEYRPGTNDYILKDQCLGTGGTGVVYTRNWNGGSPTEITSSGSNWTLTSQRKGASAHWAAEQTYLYYLFAHQRHSYDNGAGDGAPVYVYVGANGNGAANAYWGSGALHMGDGDGSTLGPIVAVDIVGHELTHGVVEASIPGGLVYSDESGALNESFADIFGTMVQDYAVSNVDYLIGEDAWSGGLRSMSNPHAKNQPDTYGDNDNDWYSCGFFSCDQQELVHTNSGVQNHWFYLLAEGGSGENANQTDFSVTGIGQASAAQIAYRNLTVYLTSTATFRDAREGSVRAAQDLFGDCSSQQAQTANAWTAVGVGEHDGLRKVCGTYGADKTEEAEIIWAASCSPPASSNCIIPSGRTVTFKAGTEIVLRDGFQSQSGSEFHAYIQTSCTDYLDKIAVDGNASPDTSGAMASITDGKLLEVVPNPFSSSTLVTYTVRDPGPVKLAVYHISGRKVMDLVDSSSQPSGTFRKYIDGTELPSGMYYVLLISGKNSTAEKIMVVK